MREGYTEKGLRRFTVTLAILGLSRVGWRSMSEGRRALLPVAW